MGRISKDRKGKEWIGKRAPKEEGAGWMMERNEGEAELLGKVV